MANFMFATERGTPDPLGATRVENGVNFALLVTDATKVTLCLYEGETGAPLGEYPLSHRTGKVWHILVKGLPHRVQYAYRTDGPNEPDSGLFFCPDTELLDPYAKAVVSHAQWGRRDKEYCARGLTDVDEPFDWGDDRPLKRPMEDLVIYEMHVRSFTAADSSGVRVPGSYSGVIEKIPYLKELGVNAVELMPVCEWDECSYPAFSPLDGQRLYNVWGYAPMNYFAPMTRYVDGKGDARHALRAVREFKQMVKELHKAGIEVILDVVYNHTGENASHGPSISYRGLSPSTYYMMDDRGHFMNFSGCGNTLKTNAVAVQQLILASLRHWVSEMHIDGFRFDLASILSRGPKGMPLANPPIINAIANDPTLADTKLIAEAWDAGGLYQVGQWSQWGRWSDWNGYYRDSVRRFIKGNPGEIGWFAARLCGSHELYGDDVSPGAGINFVTCHDGFTLRDLVSYDSKHNLSNAEDNRDGSNDNDSWNCGGEGETDDPKILALRERQMRNFHLALMISIGVPMISMGDEYGHTRDGNNNTWCQDNDLNHFQWGQLGNDFHRFYKGLIHFRHDNPILKRNTFYDGDDVHWHGQKPYHINWGKESHFVACTISDSLYVAFNANFRGTRVHFPEPPPGTLWHLIVDTNKAPPHDFTPETEAHAIDHHKAYTMAPRSALLLKAKNPTNT